MKPTLCAATISFLIALGACSGGSISSTAQPTIAPNAGGVGRNDGAPAAEAGDNGDDGGGAPGDDSSAATEFDTTLSGTDVVPLVQSTSRGTAKFFLQPDNTTLTYSIDLTNVPNPTAVSLHIGGPGEVTGVTHALTPVGARMTGQVSLTSAERDALAIDMYLDVETQSHLGGEVRGQLISPGATIFVALPTGAQEVSPPVMTAHSAHASFILSADQATVHYHIATDATPTDLTVNSAIGGLVGQVVYRLAGQLDGAIRIGDARPLQSGQLYLNIATQAHPAGELRGQIVLLGETMFAAALSALNEVPTAPSHAIGAAQAILSPTQNSIRYQVVVSGTVPTAVGLFNAPPTTNAPQPMYQLTLGPSGAQGTLDMTANDAAQLQMGGVYVNVLSQCVPSGELRGQLARQ
jgi:trimeric autotransporter adhesin